MREKCFLPCRMESDLATTALFLAFWLAVEDNQTFCCSGFHSPHHGDHQRPIQSCIPRTSFVHSGAALSGTSRWLE